VKTFKNSKIHLCFVVFGVIIGIIGIMHGCAELLQGSTLVESNSIPAMPLNWPNNEFHKVMQGSPVFSILTGIPYFVLGLLAISVSITMIVFSLTYLKNNRNILS
jgi:ABC-type amino acid transport system permease subunit